MTLPTSATTGQEVDAGPRDPSPLQPKSIAFPAYGSPGRTGHMVWSYSVHQLPDRQWSLLCIQEGLDEISW